MSQDDKKIRAAVHRALESSGMSRRNFLRLSGGGALMAGATASGLLVSRPARAVPTSAHIVIVGAGAAGLASASRLSRELDGARITIIDRQEAHYYQPGLTLVASGLWGADKVTDRNARYLPSDVEWIHDMVAEYDPDNNRVVTEDGRTVEYDYLLVTTGLQINYSDIEGMSRDLIGQHGIGCVYDRPDVALATWQAIDRFTTEGGVGLFTRAPGAIKCAGAPLKMTMLTENRLNERGTRDRAEMHYLPPAKSLFSQPDIHDFLTEHLPGRGIQIDWDHPLKAIDPGARTATFATPEGDRTLEYDFIHVVPPMSAPDALRNSPLAAPAESKFAGWLEVDQYELQHLRYANVFGAGDVNGVPIGKTSASVKAQVPVAVENLVQTIQDKENTARYNGYTSCPLITQVGRAILLEFDYDLKMIPSFPIITPYEPRWTSWLMKDYLLLPAYRAMLRGRI
ncbi:NAD(P)/FAD-dependent oxidoreductase [Ectothiorhodospira mobilis]|uniref:NAD(P)/FAD-dependent oxidoreductase n=1 Tax=Ectothiorhodospira mobilis TaxID=195064 RepID=UPI001EE9906F|nr:FAD/NAD(P)-binding oxidoreductase [Ectothiorhodospira mobilis]MCG5535265.1 NAD(P)/FAD-dependent oxidoreductase [Ectothiorhodospira mobilis]